MRMHLLNEQMGDLFHPQKLSCDSRQYIVRWELDIRAKIKGSKDLWENHTTSDQKAREGRSSFTEHIHAGWHLF